MFIFQPTEICPHLNLTERLRDGSDLVSALYAPEHLLRSSFLRSAMDQRCSGFEMWQVFGSKESRRVPSESWVTTSISHAQGSTRLTLKVAIIEIRFFARWSVGLQPTEHPVLATVRDRTLGAFGVAVVDRQIAIFGIPIHHIPLIERIRGRFAGQALRKKHFRIEASSDRSPMGVSALQALAARLTGLNWFSAPCLRQLCW
jgi:hypothetical protein